MDLVKALKRNQRKPKLIVVMGVSGSGKSTISQALASHFGFRYIDGDDYHSQEAKDRMGSGLPLTDNMRSPWVQSILGHLHQLSYMGESVVLAFSGLKKVHREKMRQTDFDVTFLFLSGDKTVIRQRLQARSSHFMPPKLLDSQFESLERPYKENDVVQVNIKPPLPSVIEQSVQSLSTPLPNAMSQIS